MSLPSSFDPVSNFRDDLDKPVTHRATFEPDCIKDLPPEHPERKELTGEEAAAAKTVLVNKEFIRMNFPRTMRMHVDPQLNGQTLGLISSIPSKNAVPDHQGCYGVLKLRGTFDSEQRADSWTDNIIRNHDSYAVIDYCLVGRPFPLMKDNTAFCSASREVDVRRKVDEVSKEDIKAKRELEKQEMESVQARHKALMADVSEEKVDKYDDLEWYTTLRTKKASLMYNKDEMLRKIKDSEGLIEQASKEIREMDANHPSFKDEFMEKYNAALAASGIDPAKNPLIKYLEAN